MTRIIATFEIEKIADGIHGEDVQDILIDVGERNNMSLISWGTL